MIDPRNKGIDNSTACFKDILVLDQEQNYCDVAFNKAMNHACEVEHYGQRIPTIIRIYLTND